MRNLTGSVAIVTGGASGLGKAIAQRLAADGARVVITDVQREVGEAVANELGITFLQQDVADETRWGQVIKEIEERFERLDILVNNAGIVGPVDASNPENTRLADWRTVFSINVESVVLGCRAVIPAMRRAGGGVIVNVSSIAGLRASPKTIAYGASKAAVRHLTKSVAQYCAENRLNIRCNSIHPGAVRTPLLDRFAIEQAERTGVSADQYFAKLRTLIPLGGSTLPEDIAAAVSFVASDDARRMTGAQVIVDGGSVGCDTYLPIEP